MKKTIAVMLIALLLLSVTLALTQPSGQTDQSAEDAAGSPKAAVAAAAPAPEALLRPEADPETLQKDLAALAAAPRPIGSAGEQEAADYLGSRFSEMGYSVILQPCTNADGQTGTTVIATRQVFAEDADILIFSAHHDSAANTYGAGDNASGAAVLLAVAEVLRSVPTDTELRFISFTDGETGVGAQAYIASLAQGEKSRIIGDIHFDQLGGFGSQDTAAATTDGQGNYLTELLLSRKPSLSLIRAAASDHASFQIAGVPSVLLTQRGRGYLYHSVADTAGQLNQESLVSAADIAIDAALEVLSSDTGSYRALAQEQGQDYTCHVSRQSPIPFDGSPADAQRAIGQAGELWDHREVKSGDLNSTYDTYLYSMYWFGGDTPWNTYCRYRNGSLQDIEIRPAETGGSTIQTRALLEGMYAAPAIEEDATVTWQDSVYGKQITLHTISGTVTVRKFSPDPAETLAEYPVADGVAKALPEEHQKIWDVICSILPQESRRKITRFRLFTDGAGGTIAQAAPLQTESGEADNRRFCLSVDPSDIFDETGSLRDRSALTWALVREYGRVLLEDETQVDRSGTASADAPAGMIADSFRERFYHRFQGTSGDSVRYVCPEAAQDFSQDIVCTFAVFLLGEEPQGDTLAEEKLRFFWQEETMVSLRSAVRETIGLE